MPEQKAKEVVMERSYGSFSGSFRLPTEVWTAKASAKFKQGRKKV